MTSFGPISGFPIASIGSVTAEIPETPQQRFTRSLLGAYSSEPVIVLLEISHVALAAPIRVTNNGEAVVSNGNTFQNYPFSIDLPGDVDTEPVARLQIANVDRAIGDAVDAITTPATVAMTLVLADSPDTLQREWAYYELRSVVRTALDITAEIPIRQYATEPFPNIRVRKSNFQNLYR